MMMMMMVFICASRSRRCPKPRHHAIPTLFKARQWWWWWWSCWWWWWRSWWWWLWWWDCPEPPPYTFILAIDGDDGDDCDDDDVDGDNCSGTDGNDDNEEEDDDDDSNFIMHCNAMNTNFESPDISGRKVTLCNVRLYNQTIIWQWNCTAGHMKSVPAMVSALGFVRNNIGQRLNLSPDQVFRQHSSRSNISISLTPK